MVTDNDSPIIGDIWEPGLRACHTVEIFLQLAAQFQSMGDVKYIGKYMFLSQFAINADI